MDIVNVVSFSDLGLRRKTPMMTQDQIKEIRKILLDYNGEALDYDNIEIFLADAGSGGGGNSWVRDSLIEDWKDKKVMFTVVYWIRNITMVMCMLKDTLMQLKN